MQIIGNLMICFMVWIVQRTSSRNPKYLDEEYEKEVFYGTYLSEKALMTCYVANMAWSAHSLY